MPEVMKMEVPDLCLPASPAETALDVLVGLPCSGRRVGDDNCLQNVNPALAAEW
jgi:hypothetical protein